MRILNANLSFAARLFVLALLPLCAQVRADVDLSNSKAAWLLAKQMPYLHISRQPLDDELAAKALQRFTATLDYGRNYFLQADTAEFEGKAPQLDDLLDRGDIRFARAAADTLIARMSNRVDYVNALLEKGFDLDTDETFRWKRKDAPWPADEAEWDELWRKRIANELIALLVSRELAKEKKDGASQEAESAPEAPKPETDEEYDDSYSKLSPEDAIRKRYNQELMIITDNDNDWVQSSFLNAFAQAYDPHSSFLSKSEMDNFDINMKLSLVGIGALLRSEDGAAKVVRLIPGGAAEADGRLKPGDKIIAVGQGDEEPVDTLHWPLDKVVRLIRGEKNTKVILKVIPVSDPSGATVKTIDLIRDEVKLEEQAAKGEIREITDEAGATRRLGVVTVPDFYADMRGMRDNTSDTRSCSKDVAAILNGFATNGVEGVVLDLRNNGGGVLTEAVKLAGLFLEPGPVVQIKAGRELQVLGNTYSRKIYSGPMITLINRQSASASEIVAGALQDCGRSIVAGDSKSHGKGTVQSMKDLDDEDPEVGAVKVTSASFYRLNGCSTQIRGVNSDIVIPSILDFMEVGEEFLPYAIPYSAIDPAPFEPEGNLKPVIAGLLEKSELRRANDPCYRAHAELLESVSKRMNADTVSLNFKERLETARQERELDSLMRDADSPEADSKNNDVVLAETLRILGDFIGVLSAARDAAMKN